MQEQYAAPIAGALEALEAARRRGEVRVSRADFARHFRGVSAQLLALRDRLPQDAYDSLDAKALRVAAQVVSEGAGATHGHGALTAIAQGLGEGRWVRWVAFGVITLKGLLSRSLSGGRGSAYEVIAAEELIVVVRAEAVLLWNKLRDEGVPRDIHSVRLFRPVLVASRAQMARVRSLVTRAEAVVDAAGGAERGVGEPREAPTEGDLTPPLVNHLPLHVQPLCAEGEPGVDGCTREKEGHAMDCGGLGTHISGATC